MSAFNVLIRITQCPLRSLCRAMAAADGVAFDGKTYLSYMQSLKPDASGNEWISFRLGKRFTFEPIYNNFGVSEWMADEPISEICPDELLDKLSAIMGTQDENITDQYDTVTVWKARYDISLDYFGDEDHVLELELLGEIDDDKLPMVVKEEAAG